MLFAVWEVGLNKRAFLFVFMESDVAGDATAAKIHRASSQGVITPLKVLQKHTWLREQHADVFHHDVCDGGAIAPLPFNSHDVQHAVFIYGSPQPSQWFTSQRPLPVSCHS